MIVLRMVRMKAKKPNVANDPALPVGQLDRPTSKCPNVRNVSESWPSIRTKKPTKMIEATRNELLPLFMLNEKLEKKISNGKM